jgi:glutaminyl-tRNA synthetase
VKGTMHWVSVNHAMDAEVRLYDRLFKVENPANEDVDFLSYLNENSLTVISNAKIEPALADAKSNDRFQFLRLGYFCADKYSTPDHLIFNRTVTLKDSWTNKQPS